jgi:general secretion pathway protein D
MIQEMTMSAYQQAMPRAIVYLVLPLFCATLAAGCAATRTHPVGDGAATQALPHRYVNTIPAKTEKSDDDKFKIYQGNGVVVKAPQVTPYQQTGGEVTLSFEGADLREVVKTVVADILKESYIMDPRVGGTITLHTKRPIPRAAILPTLETVLRMSGAVLLRQEDGVYQVIPSNMAGKGNLTPRLGEIGKPLVNGYSIQVVPLKFIGAADMAKLLEPIVPEPSAIRIDAMRNLLILSGTEPELRHMFETIDMFDVDWIAGMSVGLFTMQNVDAKTIASDLEKLLGEKNLGPLAGVLRIVPIERLNALLVVTRQPKYLEQARTWVERLDRADMSAGGMKLFVYQVQNGKAEALATLLNDAFGKKSAQKSATAPTLAPGLKPAEVKSSDAKDAAAPSISRGCARPCR